MLTTNRPGIRSRAKHAVSAAIFAGALSPAMAFAQGEPATTVDPLSVTGSRDEPGSPKYVAPLLDTPQTVTVIPAEVIQAQNLMTLRDVLSTVPGITFGAGEGGGGYGDSINLRGYSASNSISTDGLKDAAQYTRSDPFNLDQLEVSNGASSVYGGSGAVGGSINIQSKAPQAQNFVTVTGGLGLDNYRRATVDANHGWSNGVAGRLNGMVHRNDVPGRDVERYSRWGLAPSLMLGVDAMTQATFSYFHQHDDNTPQYGVPYASNSAFNGPLPGVDPSTYFGYRNIDEQVSDVDALTFRFDHEFAPDFTIRNLARWQHIDQLTIVDPPQGTWCLDNGVNPAIIPPTSAACTPAGSYALSGPRGNLRDTRNTQLIEQVALRWKGAFAGLTHSLNIGATLSEEDFHLDTGNVLRNPRGTTPNPALPVMDIADPDNVWSGPVNRIITGKTDGSLSSQALYIFDAVDLSDRWQVNGGYRWERYNGSTTTSTLGVPYPVPPAQPVVTQGPVLRNDGTLSSYRLGVVFKPNAASSLYAAVGNAETPSQESVRQGCATTTTSNTCNTGPEQARSYEIGGKWEANEGKLLVTASAFRNERTNYRVASNDPLEVDQVLDGASRVDGVTLGVSGNVTDDFSLFANYTYLTSEVLQGKSDFCVDSPLATGCPTPIDLATNASTAVDPTGRELANTPNHAASLWALYQLPREMQVGFGVTYSGDYLLSNTNISGARAPSYFVSRAMFSALVSDGVYVRVNLNNIFDEGYYTRIRSTGSGFGWATPGEGRSATVTLDKRF